LTASDVVSQIILQSILTVLPPQTAA